MPPKFAFPDPAAALPGEADILASVVATLADDTAKLVYADWLEERDDPRGPFLRECVTAFRAGKKLPAVKSFPKPWRDLVGVTLLGKVRAAKMTDLSDTFLRLARPALSFESVKTPDAKLDVGTSKFGGRPDLPAGEPWPQFRKQPLAFLGQFNFAEFHASLAGRELPTAGLLSVFSVYDEEEGNDDFEAKGAWRLLHVPDVSKLARRHAPDGSHAFKPCRLTFTETLTLPDVDSPWKKELGFKGDDELEDTYQEDVAGFVEDSGHRLLGHPSPIQGDILGKRTMRHLLTIGPDDNTRWEWGDGGALYFTVSEEDLKAGRFDRVRFEMQCC